MANDCEICNCLDSIIQVATQQKDDKKRTKHEDLKKKHMKETHNAK